MTIPHIKIAITFSLIAYSGSVFAQDKKEETKPAPAKGTLTEEIEVVRPYKPILAEAVKIRRSPDLNDTKPFRPVLSYTIMDKKLELNSNIKELQAQKLADERQAVLQNNYLKIGAGNFNTGLAEMYFNNGQDEALQAGLYLKHNSQRGNIEKQQFSNQQASVFGKSIRDQNSMSGKLSYDRKSSYFYGFDPAFSTVSTAADKQRFNLFEAEGELMNNYSEDTDLLNYAVKASGYVFNNIFDGRESTFALSGYLNKAFNSFSIGLGASTDFTSSKDSLYAIKNNILKANPFIKYQGNGFVLNLGLNLVQEFGSTSRLNILPAVSAEFPIAQEYATLFGGISGDVLKTTIRDLSNENFYLNKNVTLKNAVEKMNIYGGVKGNAGAGFGFKAMAYYKTIQDLPLFENDPFKVSRFNVVYDEGNSKLLGFQGEISIKASDFIDVSGKAEAVNYTLKTEQEAWFKPGFRLTSNLRARVTPKISFDAEVFFNGETKANTTVFTPLAENKIVTINSFVDMSAGAAYQINDKIGLHVRANNIFGTSYQQYLYYQKLGLNVFGGFNFSF
ncbi:TonB-dependent receptor [Daejeonella oryzae]|uniref:hypothetical protein n=1 Tax=Daejeonella oryzae TaxID=1122943 RepID=UPI0004272A75|nr:hypothetical protein [Daejeonella oryzae]